MLPPKELEDLSPLSAEHCLEVGDVKCRWAGLGELVVNIQTWKMPTMEDRKAGPETYEGTGYYESIFKV